MANAPFSRRAFNNLERANPVDPNLLQSQLDQTLRALLRSYCTPRFSDADDRAGNPTSGFIGEAFRVRPTAILGNTVRLRTGFGFKYDATDLQTDIAGFTSGTTGVNDLDPFKPLVLTLEETIALDAAPAAPNTRIDIIEVRYDRYLADQANIDLLNTGTRTVTTTPNIPKTLSFLLNGRQGRVVSPAASTAAIGYKVGVAAAVPVAPTVTAGYTKIAEIRVRNLVDNPANTIDEDYIIDVRPYLFLQGAVPISAIISVPTGALAPPTVTNINAPPGVKLVAVATAALGARTELFVLAGNHPQVGRLHYAVEASVFIGDRLIDVRDDYVATTLTAAQKTAIMTGGFASPAGLKVAESQPAFRVRLQTVAQFGAVTSQASPDIGDPVTYRFTGFLGR